MSLAVKLQRAHRGAMRAAMMLLGAVPGRRDLRGMLERNKVWGRVPNSRWRVVVRCAACAGPVLCSPVWEKETGDGTVYFCDQCDLEVQVPGVPAAPLPEAFDPMVVHGSACR